MATNQGFKSFVPVPNRLNAQYLYHWLRANRAYLESQGNGATFKEVSKAIVGRIEIPLPDISEQRRVAAILDQADDLRRQRRRAIESAKTLSRAIFLNTFGDPTTNTKAWPRKTLGSVSLRFSDGPFGSNLKTEHYVNEGVRVIRLQNIGTGEFLDADRAFISEAHFKTLQKQPVFQVTYLLERLAILIYVLSSNQIIFRSP